MKGVELYGQVRRAVYVEGLSRREAARRYGIDPRTVAKMLAFSVPPGYRRSRPPARPKLDPFTGIIDGILATAGPLQTAGSWTAIELSTPARAGGVIMGSRGTRSTACPWICSVMEATMSDFFPGFE